MQGITAQQQAILAQLQHAQQQQQPPPPPGVSTSSKHLTDRDDQYRNAKRRKPTALHLPTSFSTAPNHTRETRGKTDAKLADSVDALDHLAHSYRQLQQVEAKLDWTFSRKAIDLTERARPSNAGDEGLRVDRTLRVHVHATAHDQEWHYNDDDDDAKDRAQDPDRVPRVDVSISGHLVAGTDNDGNDDDDDKLPFTRHYQRVTIESPLLAAPLVWNRSASSSLPSSLEFSIPHSLASRTESVPLKVTLYPFSYSHSPTSQLFTVLPPELSTVLSVSECTRSEALHHLWLYVRTHSLIVENFDGRGTGGIRTQDSQQQQQRGGLARGGLSKKYFGGADKVAWHHLGEWVNRWLGPTVPRTIDATIVFTPADSDGDGDGDSRSHSAFDVPVSVFLSPVTMTGSSRLHQTASLLSSLSSNLPPPPTPTTATSPSAPATATAAAASAAASVTNALDQLNSQIAQSSLAVSRHLASLRTLCQFTRDPAQFLETYLGSQSSTLELALSSDPRGGGTGGRGGGRATVVGEGWKETLRGSKHFSSSSSGGGGDEWVKEAVRVWLGREQQGELMKKLAAQQQQQQAGGGGQHQQQHANVGSSGVRR